MAAFIVILVCLQLILSQTIDESEKHYTTGSESDTQSTAGAETQSTEGDSSATNMLNSADLETTVKLHRSSVALPTMSKTGHALRDQSSPTIPERFTMVTAKETVVTNPRMAEPSFSTTALATTVPYCHQLLL